MFIAGLDTIARTGRCQLKLMLLFVDCRKIRKMMKSIVSTSLFILLVILILIISFLDIGIIIIKDFEC